MSNTCLKVAGQHIGSFPYNWRIQNPSCVHGSFAIFSLRRSAEGSTPCHAAAFGGNTRILCKLVEVGGDLRLHDNKNRTVHDWALCHADPKRNKKMMGYIEKTRFFAMSHSSRDLPLERQSSRFVEK